MWSVKVDDGTGYLFRHKADLLTSIKWTWAKVEHRVVDGGLTVRVVVDDKDVLVAHCVTDQVLDRPTHF